ncbi:protein AMBP [Oryzias melastigma]|uniref:Protein AMBP n=1 Tax=Oryzias melastigma TaxID=30732 RepID=A0A3B3CVP2_ORYME|nr:protein AMBP [Oryzias melastigma]
MEINAGLILLLALGWSQTLQALPILPDPLYPTQENFVLMKFLGTWYDVVLATTSPNLPKYRQNTAIGKWLVQKSAVDTKLKTTRTALRYGMCKEVIKDMELTGTQGRFFYTTNRSGSKVDAYVLHTNYNEYAVMILNKIRPSGEKITNLRLYSRTMTVRPSVLEDFKTLVKEQGMGEDTILIKEDKGLCVPGEQVAEPEPEPQPNPQRWRRQVLPSLSPADVEGSGAEMSLFNGTEACASAPDSGPCFGMVQRYFYNSTSLTCELFNFGGCLGNQNNFVTEKECLQRCRPEAVCRLPIDVKPCMGSPPVWAFNSTSGLCMPSKQGYCQANGNKFYTKAECEEYCGVIKADEELLMSN